MIQLNPQFVAAPRRLGDLLLRRGRASEAAAFLERATGLDPAHAHTWYLLVRASERVRDRPAALAAASRFLALAAEEETLRREVASIRDWLRSVTPPLEDLERAYLGGLVRTVLSEDGTLKERETMRRKLLERAPERLREDDQRWLVVTLFPPQAGPGGRRRAVARGPNLVVALTRACDSLLAEGLVGDAGTSSAEAAVVVDIERGGSHVLSVSEAGGEVRCDPPLNPGRHGVVLTTGDRSVVVVPAEAVWDQLSGGAELLALAARRAGLGPSPWAREGAQLTSLQTESFLVPPHRGASAVNRGGTSSGILPLRYGAAPAPVVSQEELLDATRRGAHWLLGALAADGRFVYEYAASDDEESLDYEILRHAGTVVSLVEAARATGGRDMMAGARLAGRFLASHIVHDARGIHLRQGGIAKLGGQALALLAFSELAVKEAHPAAAGVEDQPGSQAGEAPLGVGRAEAGRLRDGLADRVLAMQREDGSFESYYLAPGEAATPRRASRFYPGEAVYALAVAASRSGRKTWLQAAVRGAGALFAQREAERRAGDVPLDAWLLKALAELHGQAPDPRFLQWSWVLADAALDYQLRPGESFDPSWVGGYGVASELPWGAGTAALNEGVAAAAALAARNGDARRATRYREAAVLAAQFQLAHQFRPSDAYWLPRPRRAMGGFRFHLRSDAVRIDTVQHNISSLLMVRSLLLGDEKAGG